METRSTHIDRNYLWTAGSSRLLTAASDSLQLICGANVWMMFKIAGAVQSSQVAILVKLTGGSTEIDFRKCVGAPCGSEAERRVSTSTLEKR